MPFRREFIDWSHHALPAAADFLVRSSRRGNRADLRNVVVAVPGGRIGRRLLELLVDRAELDAFELVPPRIITAGALPELLYQAKKPFADDLTQRLAWVAALRETDRETLASLVRQLPDPKHALPWLPLGEMLATLHRELAADGLNCRDVVDIGRRLAAFPDARRWTLLADIQERYLRQLDRLELWDRQTARLYAIRHRECRTDCDIVLVGTVDMNRVQRSMLDQVADRVTSLVVAPRSLADRFDEHGCVIAEAWQEVEIPLDPKRVTVVDGPGDQADAVVRALAALDGRYSAEDIVVGVPDERIVPYVEQRLQECELPVRYGVGSPVLQSEPCRLLGALADWLDSGRFESLADLLRHPALERRLLADGNTGDILSASDKFFSERLPWELRDDELQATIDELVRRETESADDAYTKDLQQRLRTRRLLQSVVRRITELTQPLRSGKKRLGDWGDDVVAFLLAVYGTTPLDGNAPAERLIVAGCRAIHEAQSAHRGTPESLSPKVTGAEALRLILKDLARESVPPPADEAAIEFLGWLELPLDDAPVLIVTGFNEGIVPSSRNADVFLPNELRMHLKLEDNERRYARDAYALCVLAASRKELRVIAGRRTAENDPLIPSRLLFACDATETARRTLRWMGERKADSGRLLLPAGLRCGGGTRFSPPLPRPIGRPIDSMRITEFRDYLACPYRYYLRHRLRLSPQNDATTELDAGQFGNLLHETLNLFGKKCLDDPAFAGATSAGEIEAFLDAALDGLSRGWFGSEPLPAVRVQVELIRRRLRRFAAWQADWARQGWRVRYVEHDLPKDRAALDLPSGPMRLRGRIDRIDTRGRDETMLFDYKTGDAGKSPEETHGSSAKGWLDLQLPLYRYSCQWLDVGRNVGVGYIVLPRKDDDAGAKIAAWDQPHYDEAIAEAKRIASLVRGETFWPPAPKPPGSFDEFAAICGDYRFANPALEDLPGESDK